jgi:hypothetical protein
MMQDGHQDHLFQAFRPSRGFKTNVFRIYSYMAGKGADRDEMKYIRVG